MMVDLKKNKVLGRQISWADYEDTRDLAEIIEIEYVYESKIHRICRHHKNCILASICLSFVSVVGLILIIYVLVNYPFSSNSSQT